MTSLSTESLPQDPSSELSELNGGPKHELPTLEDVGWRETERLGGFPGVFKDVFKKDKDREKHGMCLKLYLAVLWIMFYSYRFFYLYRGPDDLNWHTVKLGCAQLGPREDPTSACWVLCDFFCWQRCIWANCMATIHCNCWSPPKCGDWSMGESYGIPERPAALLETKN